MEAFIASGGLSKFYQCGVVNHTQEEWYAQGQVHLVHGIACIVFGVTCQLLYIPCLFVLTQKDIIEITAYKLMLFITICDLLNLTTNGLMTGFFMGDGAVYCNYPYAMYLWGCVEMGQTHDHYKPRRPAVQLMAPPIPYNMRVQTSAEEITTSDSRNGFFGFKRTTKKPTNPWMSLRG